MSREAHDLVAPASTFAEVTSLLRKLVVAGRIDAAEAERLFTALEQFQIAEARLSDAVRRTAWEVAKALGQSDTFDAIGYAVAEHEGGQFWTADRRFANAAGGRLPRLRFIE